MELITEFEFELPRGYVDENGEVHKKGVMRLATAADEILPLRDPRVVSNPAYLTIILLSRVVTSLGTLTNIRPTPLKNCFPQTLHFCRICIRPSIPWMISWKPVSARPVGKNTKNL